MKQLSFFRTAIHLNIDIACVHASPKELVPNGLRVDVPLLIHLPPLIIVILSVVVVPSGENHFEKLPAILIAAIGYDWIDRDAHCVTRPKFAKTFSKPFFLQISHHRVMRPKI